MVLIIVYVFIIFCIMYYYFFVLLPSRAEIDTPEPLRQAVQYPEIDSDPARVVLRARYEFRDQYVEISEECDDGMECIHWSRTESDIDSGFLRCKQECVQLFIKRGIAPPAHFGAIVYPPT
jgi:hypothetical protein